MNALIIFGIAFLALGTYLIQLGRTKLAFNNTDKITKHINSSEEITRTKILEGLNLSSQEVVKLVNSQTEQSTEEILIELGKGFSKVQEGADNISDILTGGETYPFFNLSYRSNSNQLQFNLSEKGKHKLPNKSIQVYNLSPNRDRDMLKVSKPAEQYLIEKTSEYLEFYIDGSTKGKLSSWLFEVITIKEDFVYLIVRTESDNGITRQLYYVDNLRDDNFFMDSYKHVEGLSGVFKDKVLETHSDKGIKLFDNGKPVPDTSIPSFGQMSIELKRDWKNRKDVDIPDGWGN